MLSYIRQKPCLVLCYKMVFQTVVNQTITQWQVILFSDQLIPSVICCLVDITVSDSTTYSLKPWVGQVG